MMTQQHRRQAPVSNRMTMTTNSATAVGNAEAEEEQAEEDDEKQQHHVDNKATTTASSNAITKHSTTTSHWLTPVVLCILGTETSERFAYFGFRAILVLYFTMSLQYSESTSIALYAYMTSLAYLTPLLGALLADGAWGFYPTIFWFGIIYAVGLMMMTWAASLGTTTTNTTIATMVPITNASGWQQVLSFGGLFLVCLGTGGIKPCVSAFGANQVAASTTAIATATLEVSLSPTPDHSDSPSVMIPPVIIDERPSALPVLSSERHVQDFFAYFYFCINVGAVLSIATIPLAREYYGFTAAFGIPTLFMWGAVGLFWSKRHDYIHHHVPSNTLAATMIMCCQLSYQRWYCSYGNSDNTGACCYRVIMFVWRPCHEGCRMIGTLVPHGIRRRLHLVGRTPLPHTMGRPALVPTHTKDDDDDDHPNASTNNELSDTTGGSNLLLTATAKSRNYGSQHPLDGRENENDNHRDDQMLLLLLLDAEQVLRVLPIMAMFPIFWMLYDQQGSVWTLQATRMRLHGLQPEQLTLVNPIEIMVFIPLFQQVIYPFLTRRGWSLKPTHRIQTGMVLAALSFFASGLLESAIQRTESSSSQAQHDGTITTPPPSVFWQLIQITILAVSEILVSVTGLEWAYDTAPHRIKALLMAIFLLTTAVGDLLGGILYSTVFQTWNRATVLHVCATLLLMNRLLFDLVVSRSSLAQQHDHQDDEEQAGRLSSESKEVDGYHAVLTTTTMSDNVSMMNEEEEVHHHSFKELTNRSLSIIGVELPTVRHDAVH